MVSVDVLFVSLFQWESLYYITLCYITVIICFYFYFFSPWFIFKPPGKFLTSSLRAVCARLFDKQTADPPSTVRPETTVCIMTWSYLHWAFDAECWQVRSSRHAAPRDRHMCHGFQDDRQKRVWGPIPKNRVFTLCVCVYHTLRVWTDVWRNCAGKKMED